MYLLLYISLGFNTIALSLLGLAILWAENKSDEAYNLSMQVRPPTELIGMRGRCAVVHWYTAHRYYSYTWHVYARREMKLLQWAIALSLVALALVVASLII